MNGFASRGLILAAGLILTAAIALPWLFPPGEGTREGVPPLRQPAANPQTPHGQDVPAQQQAPEPEDVQAWVAQEAIQIGALHDDPSESMERLQKKAGALSGEDIRALEALALENGREGDRRFLAVELLTMNAAPESARSLERIAVSSRPQRPLEPQLETALRARAIEGLGSHRSGIGQELLKKSLARLDESFLLDRAHRALLATEGAARSPEEQDQEALGRLLGVESSENETR